MPQIAFYSGELMSPEAIRAADPNASFIARGWIAANVGELPDEFATGLGGEIWGIAVSTSQHLDGTEIEVTLDDGRIIEAILAEPLLGGDSKAVLANARYWELPPAFVAHLRLVVERGLDEE